jgi:DNA-binding NtrC family response regulator
MNGKLQDRHDMTELKTILHVDDDEDILEITRMALQLVDTFELHQCSSGRSVERH